MEMMVIQLPEKLRFHTTFQGWKRRGIAMVLKTVFCANSIPWAGARGGEILTRDNDDEKPAMAPAASNPSPGLSLSRSERFI
jgi:hypothetical protein